MNEKYKEIYNLPHKQSNKRVHMSNYDRAAQFAPFAALTGYDAAVRETARLTDTKLILSDVAIEQLNEKLIVIGEHLSENPNVTITYFTPDERKSGGAYVDITGTVKKIDDCTRTVIMHSGVEIPIEDIFEIECSLFDY